MTIKESRMRSAKADDLAGVEALLMSVNLPTEGVKPHLEHFLVLDNGEALIGTVGLEVYGESALLRSLAVKPEHQRAGWGKRLYDTVVERARSLGIEELILLTETAEGFFRKQGFEVVSRDAVDARVKRSVEFETCCPASAVCMRKRLC